MMTSSPSSAELIDSRYAFGRLMVVLLAMIMGGSCMFVVAVVLPAVQLEFGVSRSDAAIPYTLLMVGFGVGGIYMGRIVDRWGVQTSLLVGAVGMVIGFVWAGMSEGLLGFALAHGIFLGFLGSSATFAPLVADTAMWWSRYRGIAVAVCASGSYLSGAVWPRIAQWGVDRIGWRDTYIWMGIVAGVSMALLSLLLKRRAPTQQISTAGAAVAEPFSRQRPFGMTPGHAQALLIVAGIACCVAMSMPQVHIVAYCVDLGYGPTRGAEMLSLMLAFGVISRLASGYICDRIGGVRTLLLGSALQAVALVMFLPFDGLVSLYVISAVFGLFQGGIVPSYAIIVREYFPIQQIGQRVGAVLMATMLGMALGGWLSGQLYDWTGSYQVAVVNGMAWNALNLGIALWLLWRIRQHSQVTPKMVQPG
jgi:MFS family permease